MSRELPTTNWVALAVFAMTGYVITFAGSRVMFFRDLTGAQLDVLPGMMVYAAMAFRTDVVLGCGCLFGLFYDSLSANVFGSTFVSLAVIGLSASRFRELLLSDQFITHWVLGLIASGVAPLISVLIQNLSGNQPLLGLGSLWQWLIMTAGGGFVTPLWFKFFNRLDDASRFKELPEITFRPDRQIARGKR
jgi:rod shape-determining protein MreD